MRTKEQYREKIFSMKPNVCIGGKMVRRDDPRLIPGINVLELTYELAPLPGFSSRIPPMPWVEGSQGS